ncbi:lysophospholipase [Thalassobaculum litoreum DSM 18839]|uniref:Lysophospholipase n=2 Tax=Thalassobaculaceae TaxID=2844864 RepID=A0A8G2EW41_9PROT|nr:lysophospholipase [Thalassobaculum litoreum DSM 18839]
MWSGSGKVSIPDTIEEAGGETRWLDRPDGMHLRYAVFGPAGPAGWCVFLPGYTEFIEKHLETAADLRARGFGVLCLDWRGQGLSARYLPDRSKGHVDSFDTHLADLDAVIADAGLDDVGPLTVVGHSMGGHLAIWYCRRHPERVKRGVAIAPMIGVAALKPSIGSLLAVFCTVGMSGRYVFGGSPYGPRRRQFEGNKLTTDPVRFDRAHRLIAENPDLAVADPTFGWARAAWRSIQLTHRPGWFESIRAPILVVLAGRDRIVDNVATKRAIQRLPHGVGLRIPEAEHEILGEIDPIRDQLWEAFDRFCGLKETRAKVKEPETAEL